jgi:hypothetical protein
LDKYEDVKGSLVNAELTKAQKSFLIQDVYISEANLWADRTIDPSTMVAEPSHVQFKLSPTTNCETILLDPPVNNIRYLVRYMLGTGLRVLKSSADPANPNITRDDLLVEIQTTFVVRYAVVPEQEPPTPEMIMAFNDNAIHHVWPYWREFLQAAALRLRVPPIILPMHFMRPTENPDASPAIAAAASPDQQN